MSQALSLVYAQLQLSCLEAMPSDCGALHAKLCRNLPPLSIPRKECHEWKPGSSTLLFLFLHYFLEVDDLYSSKDKSCQTVFCTPVMPALVRSGQDGHDAVSQCTGWTITSSRSARDTGIHCPKKPSFFVLYLHFLLVCLCVHACMCTCEWSISPP